MRKLILLLIIKMRKENALTQQAIDDKDHTQTLIHAHATQIIKDVIQILKSWK